jgi:hypothetical protein
VDPVPDPMLPRKSGSAGNRTRDLWICSQKLLPLDHKGGLVSLICQRILVYPLQKKIKEERCGERERKGKIINKKRRKKDLVSDKTYVID